MRRLAPALLALAACTSAPPREGQVLLYVTTDAPLAAAPGEPALEVPALFDRLRFTILPAGAMEPCAGCTRELGVHRGMLDGGEASVGIAPKEGEEGVMVRIQLYRSGGTAAGEPRPGSTLETLVRLPVVAEGDLLERHVVLGTDDVAQPLGPVDPEAGPAPAGMVGSWARAKRSACEGEPGPEEVCVPGGAYWMGDPRMELDAAFDLDGELERLVALPAFYLDESEVTVAAFRSSGLAEPLSPGGPSNNPYEAGGTIADCMYTSDPGPFEDRPVNCLSWSKAEEYCASLGKRLPTEAELEYVMSGLGRGRYVWGEEAPSCRDAVYARGTLGACTALGSEPAPVGSAVRDRLVLPGGELLDLAGNVQEWAADRWNREHEPCWGTGLFLDPLCEDESPSDGFARSLRGGDWDGDEVDMRAALRSRLANQFQAVSARIGFRCAR